MGGSNRDVDGVRRCLGRDQAFGKLAETDSFRNHGQRATNKQSQSLPIAALAALQATIVMPFQPQGIAIAQPWAGICWPFRPIAEEATIRPELLASDL